MSTLIFCHDIDEFYLLYKQSNYNNFFLKKFFILSPEIDLKKFRNYFFKDKFFFQDHQSKFPEFDDYILDKSIISQFKDTELLFMQSLDYFEYEGSSNTNKESRQTFYYYLNNILKFIKINNFKNVYFTHTPHGLIEILVLSIFRKLKLRTIFVRGLPIAHMYTYQENIFTHNKIKKYRHINHYKKPRIHGVIKRFIKKSKSDFNFASNKSNKWTDYRLVQIYGKFYKLNSLVYCIAFFFFFSKYFIRVSVIIFKSLLFFFYNLFSNKKIKYFYLDGIITTKHRRLQYSRINRLNFEKILLIGYLKKNQNLKYYYSLIDKNFNLKEKYIYFPLWFQPSSTTYPFAGRMVDYEISINMLSYAIPSNYKILIKESPDIFNISKHSWFKGNFSRNKSFYYEISKNKKIKLVDFFYKDSELIDNSVAVASLCDKFNLIALIRGKPSITFTNTITTANVQNSFYCKNIKDIQNALSSIIKNNRNDIRNNIKNLDVFFSILSKNSFYNPQNLGFNGSYEPYDYKKAATLLKEII
jgi:hypothetical protein